jgi:hypothetical protein
MAQWLAGGVEYKTIDGEDCVTSIIVGEGGPGPGPIRNEGPDRLGRIQLPRTSTSFRTWRPWINCSELRRQMARKRAVTRNCKSGLA